VFEEEEDDGRDVGSTDLFLHEVGDILFVERTQVKTLPTLQKEASDREPSRGIRDHWAQTRQHSANAESPFEFLSEMPKVENSPAIEGLENEQGAFVADEPPSAAVRDSFLTSAGAQTEHYAFAAYGCPDHFGAGDGRAGGREAPVGEPVAGTLGTREDEDDREASPAASARSAKA
jgi:ferritin-like metal-binding protein YciE